MDCTACTGPQCLYKGALYLTLLSPTLSLGSFSFPPVTSSLLIHILRINFASYWLCRLGSSVDIATELLAGRFGDRIPVGARLSASVQTGPRTQPANYTMGTGSFLGVKSGRGVTLTSHHLLVPLVVKE